VNLRVGKSNTKKKLWKGGGEQRGSVYGAVRKANEERIVNAGKTQKLKKGKKPVHDR